MTSFNNKTAPSSAYSERGSSTRGCSTTVPSASSSSHYSELNNSDGEASSECSSSTTENNNLMPLNLAKVTGQLLGRTVARQQLLDAVHRCISTQQDTKKNDDGDDDAVSSSSSSSKVVVAHGESGSGKSALVQKTLEEYDDEQQQKWSFFFVQGKFIQFESRNNAALTNAVAELCHLILQKETQQQKENGSFLETLRKNLVEALGEQELAVLVQLLPIVQTVVSINNNKADDDDDDDHKNDTEGTRTKEDSLSVAKEASLQRFVLLLRTFLNVVSKMHPVVFWLDDLQWADETSLRLVESVALSNDTTSASAGGGLLLLCTMRDQKDNDDDDDDTFAMVQRMLQPALVPVQFISVGPITEATVNEIVATATDNERDKDKTQDLAALIFRKTRGNIYYCIEYLEMLHREGLLTFNMIHYDWEWNVDAIDARANMSENVVHLLTRKISALSTDTQVVLMVAACLGFTFDQETLQAVVSKSGCLDSIDTSSNTQPSPSSSSSSSSLETRVATAYKKASRDGLLEQQQSSSSSKNMCKFSHDRVRQSAMELIPDGTQGIEFRHQVGTVLLEMFQSSNDITATAIAAGKEEWMLFSALELLASDSLILQQQKQGQTSSSTDNDKNKDLARLCMLAAKRAAKRSAFVSQAKFADKGIALLANRESSMWEDEYELCLELHTLSSQGHYSFESFEKRFEKSSQSIEEILKHGRCLDDIFRAQMIRLAIFGAAADMANGIKACTKTLLSLGVHIRRPGRCSLAFESYKVKRLLKGRQARDLYDLPTLKDPATVKALQILDLGIIYAWRAGDSPTLVAYILKMMELTVQHGLGVHGPISLALYGAHLGTLGDYDGGFEYGRVAEDMCFRPGRTRDGVAATINVNHLCLHHMKKPVFESLDKALQAYHIAREIGDVMLAAYCLQMHGMLGVVVGMPLDGLEKEMSGYCGFCREFRQESCLMDLLPYHQLALNLLGRSKDPLLLTGMAMVEPDFVVRCRNSSEGATSLLLLIYAKTLLYYLLDELDLADAERCKINPKQDFAPSYIMMPLNYFFCSMTCLGLARRSKSRKYKREADKYIALIASQATAGSPNCAHMLALLKAEQQALGDRSGAVSKEYDKAISMSARSGFRLIKAIALERAGEYMIVCGDDQGAKSYLGRAWSDFSDYGAHAKLAQMKRKYDSLLIDFEAVPVSQPFRVSRKLQPHKVESRRFEE